MDVSRREHQKLELRLTEFDVRGLVEDVAPEVLPRVFELFTQEARARDLVPGGLGVGLAIVSQIAELHGGAAQARSGSGGGKGSEFTLRFPREGPPAKRGVPRGSSI